MMQTLLQAHDHVIVFTPCYQSLQAIPEAIGCEVSTIALEPENNWNIPLEKVEKAIRPTTKLIVLNIPHNPTGMLLSKETMDGILLLARKHNIYIFCDEVYRFLEIDEEMRLPSIADSYDMGISLNVMTKSFGLAGLRIGWLACKDKALLEKIAAYKLYTSICNSAPSEILAVIALRAKKEILARNRAIMLNNLQLLDTFFAKYPTIFSWKRPQSGSMAFVEYLSAKPIDQFTEELVQQAQVLIMPATVFNLKKNFFRIGFGKKSMPDVLQRFEQFVIKTLGAVQK